MFSILQMTYLLITANLVAGDSPPALICWPNEEYTCGPVCIETCDYKPEICTANCRFGCFCQEGYVRASNTSTSACVKREDCKEIVSARQCGENEEYQRCASACPPTCDDFTYPLPKQPKNCMKMCKSGCFCKEGYYRAKNGQCVKPEQCCVGENEQYSDCGPACVETCTDAPQECTLQCVAGCFCASNDYVRQNNSSGSLCIQREKC